MNKEQQMFLNIISDHLQGRETIPAEENLDWQQINGYAQSHQLGGIVNHQLRGLLSGKHECKIVVREMEKAKMACLFCYVSMSHAFDEIQHAFCEEQIRFFSVKGLEVASCYPIPAFRTMGDLDIVVFPKDKKKASQILENLGFVLTENNYGLQYKKNSINLEMDDHLLHMESMENDIRRKFFNSCWKYVNVNSDGLYQLDKNFHYLYIVEHTKKHFRTRGIGFRQFIDLAVYAQKHSDLDWEWIKKQLQKTNLLRFAVLAHTFIYRWWGIESPFEVETLDSTFFEQVTDYVFSSGVFGFDNIYQSLYIKEAKMNSDSKSNFFSSLRYVAKNTFIPYEKMIRIPYCSFVVGKRWLLPFGWLYRVAYLLRYRKEYTRKQKMQSIGAQEIIDNHRELMEKWDI